MKFSLDTLYCIMPANTLMPLGKRGDYCFGLPDNIYTERRIAELDMTEGEMVVTLNQAFNRISSDIHYDA